MEKKIVEEGSAVEPDRKMAYVAKISGLEPIPKADKIMLAQVLGWSVVVKKDEFKVGDLCIYYTLGSLLDDTNPGFDFLKDKGKIKDLRTRKIRGVISQGLLTPLSAVKYYGVDPDTLKEGDDVTEIMKIKKYVPPEEKAVYTVKGGKTIHTSKFPSYLHKTDEERIQNSPHFLEYCKGKQVVITRKEDGTSGTFSYKDGEFLICSRNQVRMMGLEGDLYCEIEKRFNIGESMKKLGRNIGVQGEIVGPGINKNMLHLSDIDFRVFNVWFIDELRYGSHEEIEEICGKLGLHMVPLLYKGIFKEEWMTVSGIMKYAESIEYYKGGLAEGIVVKLNDPTSTRRLSFKVVSNAYLLKHNQ